MTGRTCTLLAEEALCFYKPLPHGEISLKDLVIYAIDSVGIGDWLLFVLATLAVSLVGLLSPWLHGVLYTEASLFGSLRALASAGAFLLCAGFAGVLLGTYKYLTLGRISGKAGAAVQAAGMARLLALPPSFFQSHSAGELQSRLRNIPEPARLQWAFLGKGVQWYRSEQHGYHQNERRDSLALLKHN